MAATDQPSILTVCVPGGTSGPGALDVSDIHAAREQSLARAAAHLSGSVSGTPSIGLHAAAPGAELTRCRPDASECNAPGCSTPLSECDGCDDSACGVEMIGNASSACGSRSSVDSNTECHRNGRACAKAAGQVQSPALCQPSFFHADSGKKALELLRMLRFDLLVTGDQLPDMPVSQLIRRVRIAWPWQKWAMVGSMITTQDEIAARTLGAMAIFDAPPDWEVLGSLASIAAGNTRPVRGEMTNGEAARLLSILKDGVEPTGAGSSAVRRSISKARSTRGAMPLPSQRTDRSVGDRAVG